MLRLYNLKGEEILILRHSRKIDSYIQGEAFEITVSKSKDGTKEMSFQIPIHIDIDSIQEVNERWVNLQVGLLLRYEEKDDTVDWYRITEIEDKRDSLATCQITAKHTSYDLNRKGLGKVIDLVDTPEVILNAILSGTGWSVGTISSSLVSKVRTFTAEAKSNCLEMLNKVAEIFKGYLQFNGDYTVDLLEDIGNKQGQVSFRYKKNLINVQRTVSFDSLISKLWLYGGDDGTGVISIESVNPTKNSFIYNFSYFLQTGQMPNNAEQIIAQYNIDILAVNTNISNTQANINAKNTELISLEAQLQYKQNLLTARQNLLSEIEAKIALTDPSDLSYPTLLNEKNKTQTEINNLLVQVSSLSSQVNDLQDLIDSYIDTLENYQNQKEIIENNFQEVLGDFIFEGIETENDIIDPQELFEDGIKLLDKACYPAITYNLTIADLSKLSGYEIESISLGDRIHCFDELLNLDIELEITKIIEVVDNWENTKLEVGNMNTVFEDLFKRIVDSANTVKNKQSNWDNNTKTVQQALEEAIEAQRLANTALQRADGKVDAFSQAVMPHPEYINVPENSIYDNYVGDLWHDTTSDKTYWYEKSPNGSNYDYKWVEKSIPKEVFDMIDGKNTVFYNTPTPPYHVGDLWSLGDNEVDLRICIVERLTGSFNPADWGLATNAKAYIDQEISDVNSVISELETEITTTFKDGVISEAEANSIATYLNLLNTEKADVDKRYDLIYGDTNLSGITKTNLANAKTSYNTAHTNLINSINTAIADGKITPEEKTDIDNKFTAYKNALIVLTQRFEESVRFIEQVKANAAENNAKTYADEQIELVEQDITDVDNRVTNLNIYIDNTFKDGIITTSEAQAIEKYINSLTVEKQDIDNRYAIIYADSYLTGTPKTNLENAKIAYNTAHTNLINSINTAIADGQTSPTEKADVDTKFTSYKTALGALSTRFEEAIRSVEQAKANAAENNAKDYIDQEISDVNSVISELETEITTTFKDGVISEAEANSIATYLNLLNTEKADVDKRYDLIYGDTNLSGITKTNLANAKTSYNTAHTNLINSINTAIADGKITPEEKTDIDNKFTAYKNALIVLTQRFEESVRFIEQVKANAAENNAKTYADEQIELVEQDITDVDNRVTNLNIYIDNTFKDGIITTSEAQAIEKYINSLTVEKQDIDNRYAIIYADSYLTGTPKTNLENAKIAYNTAHTNLINSINTAIADGQTSPTEKADVDTKFTSYKTALGALSTRFEEAIRSVEQAKANAAENNAKDYVDLEIGEVNNAIEGLEENINKFSSDLILTLAEANFIKLSLENLTSESTDLINIATSLSIATEKTNYQNALTTLTNYLNTNWLGKTYPLTITSGQRTNVTNYFKDVEDKKSILVNKIVAVREANAKQYTDDTANAKIADMADDNKLTPNEKIAVLNDKDIIVAEYTSILAQGTAYGITTEKTNYTNAYNALISYLTPLLTDLSSTSSIDGAEFRTKFSNYYNTKAILLKAVSDKAVQQANLYNGIMITEQNGFQVFDNQSTPVDRIKMGQISPGIFGQRLKYANGNVSSETLSDGTQRMYDKDGNIIFDSGGLNPLEIAGFGIVRGLTFQATNISYAFKATTTVKNDYIAGSANLYLNSVANIAVGDHIIVDYADGFTSKNHVVTGVYTDYVTVKTGTSSPYSFPKDIKAGTTVCIISQSVRNGSTCDITISAGSATLPNGKYISLSSNQTLSNVDCKANATDADGFEYRAIWIGGDGIIRYASTGTFSFITEAYPNVYFSLIKDFPGDPRTRNLGTGTNTPDPNAVILGYLLVGWGLGYHPPVIFMHSGYRDERPIKIERNVGDYNKTFFAGSNTVLGSSFINLSLTSNERSLKTIALGYGVKCAIVGVCKDETEAFPAANTAVRYGGLIVATLLDRDGLSCMGTIGVEISSSPKFIMEYYSDSGRGYILAPSALGTNYIKLERAWLEIGYDKQTYLQLAFSTTTAEDGRFRLYYQGF